MSRNPNVTFIDILREAVSSGAYSPGQLLPSERKLAADYKVGRGVVRNALKQLASEGVITLIPHRGACVNKNNSQRKLRRFMLCCDHISNNPNEMLSLMSEVCLAAAGEHAEVLVSFASDSTSNLNIEDLVWRVQQNELQGVMIVEHCPQETLEELKNYAIPHVVINQEAFYSSGSCRIDHRAIGRLAGMRLLKTAYKNFAAVSGNQSLLVFREMLAGFRGALAEEENTLAKDAVFELLPTFSEANYRDLVNFLAGMSRPLALFAMRDSRAEFVYRACRELNLQIPNDVAVIGYDNLSWQEAPVMGLTTITQPMNQLARNAVKMLKEWCENGKPAATTTICGEIIERKSLP